MNDKVRRWTSGRDGVTGRHSLLNSEAFFANSSMSDSISWCFPNDAARALERASAVVVSSRHRDSTMLWRSRMSSERELPSETSESFSAVNAEMPGIRSGACVNVRVSRRVGV
jgi:hypothetical protein